MCDVPQDTSTPIVRFVLTRMINCSVRPLKILLTTGMRTVDPKTRGPVQTLKNPPKDIRKFMFTL